MMRIKCSKCQAVISLEAVPAGGRVFCNHCGQQLVLQAPGGAAQPPQSPVVTPVRPVAARPSAPQIVEDDEVIDLQASAKAAPLPQAQVVPTLKAQVVRPAAPAAPSRPVVAQVIPERGDDEREHSHKPKKKKKRAKSSSNAWIIGASVAGVGALLLGVVIYFIVKGGDGYNGPLPAAPRVAQNEQNRPPRSKMTSGPADTPPSNQQGQQNQPGRSNRGDEERGSSGSKGNKGNDARGEEQTGQTEPTGSTEQPTHFGGATEGSGADVYTYVLKSATCILAADVQKQGIAMGSGSLVDKKNRLVLTNHHVAGAAEKIAVFFPTYDKNGKLIAERDRFFRQFRSNTDIIEARVVAADKKTDLCLLQLQRLPSGVEGLPIAKQSCRVGHRVHSVGNPGISGAVWVYAPGVVRQVYRDKWKSPGDTGFIHEADVIETQSPTNQGDSGGPLVNDRGELVGVTQSILQTGGSQLSRFIDISEVKKFVESAVQDRLNLSWDPDVRAPMTLASAPGSPAPARLSELVKNLESGDSKVRLKAIESLGELGDKAKDAIPSLLKLLGDNDEFTRRTAVSALVKIGLPSKTDVQLLAGAMREPNVEMRRYAATTLEKMGTDARSATPELVGGLTDNDALVRQAAARALGRLGREVKESAAGPLETMLGDNDKDNRLAAAEALAGIHGSTGDVEALRKLLKHQDTDIRAYTAKALVKLGKNAKAVMGDLLEIAKNDFGELRRATILLLASLDAADAKAGLPLITDSLKGGDKESKLAALAALGPLAKELPPSTINAVREALKDPELKTAAIEALAKIAPYNKTALGTLVEMTKQNDESGEAAMKALGDLGPAAVGAAGDLIRMMDLVQREVTQEDSARVSKYAALLGKMGKPAIPALRRGLTSRNFTRWGCAKALGEMGPLAREAINDLRAVMNQEINEFIRRDMEEALRKILNQ